MERQRWATRMGLILAMAGNAIGLGNFLRFPGQAAQNGGGAFMIPYVIALLAIGIPMMWIEWAIGRRGGRYGFSTAPGFFHKLWRNPAAKYLGALGLFIPIAIVIYYTYICSWTLAYAFFSATGQLFRGTTPSEMGTFLQGFLGVREGSYLTGSLPAYVFFLLTMALTLWILRHGISGGIERLAKIGMPALFIIGILLLVRVMTLGHPEGGVASVWEGFNYVWEPQWAMLGDFRIWLAAAGQIFFTLSVGTAIISTYSSYLTDKDDVALSGITTASTNEFAEVVLGGSIAIPIAVAFLGIAETQKTAGSAFNLAFVSLPLVFERIPLGAFFSCIWFLLLFIAGITSVVALAQPWIAFLEDHFQVPRKKAATIGCLVIFLGAQPIILVRNFLDQVDFWTVNIGLAVFALLEAVLFMWVLGSGKAWKELHLGADIRIPGIFRYVMAYLTPAAVLALLIGFTWQDLGSPTSLILMRGASPADLWVGWGARALILATIVLSLVFVHLAWKRQGLPPVDREEEKP